MSIFSPSQPVEQQARVFEEPKVPPVSNELAVNKAVSDSFVNQSDTPISAYKQARQQGTVLRDQVTQLVYDQLGEDFIEQQLWGKVMGDPNATVEDLHWALSSASRHLKFNDLNREQTLLIAAVLFNKDNPGVLSSDSNVVANLASIARQQDVDVLREEMKRTANAASTQLLDEYVATLGWDNVAIGTIEGLANELVPVANVLTKSAITSVFFDPLNLDWQNGRLVLLGEARQAIRDRLVEMSPEAREEAIEEILTAVKALRQDPTWSAAITDYAILEAFENVFTEDVIEGRSSKNTLDRWIGNFETAFEALWSGWMVTRAGRTIRDMRRSADTLEVVRAARIAGDRKTQTRAIKWLRSEINKETGIDPAEAATGVLPTPAPLRDQRLVEFEGAEEAVKLADRRAQDAYDVHRANPIGLLLTEGEKANVEALELAKITRADRLAVQPQMSVVEEASDLSGIHFDVVVSKGPDEAFGFLSEVFNEIDHLDPFMEHTRILRRGADGTLEEVKFANTDELLEAASKDFKALTDKQLLDISEGLSKQDPLFKVLDREAQVRAGNPRTIDDIAGDEFFIEVKTFRPYHPIDKETLGQEGLRNTFVPDILLTPNSQFSERGMMEAITAATLDDQRLVRNLERIVEPYHKLNKEGKKRVNAINEWLEEESTRLGQEPDLYDVLAHFPTLTAKERAGYIAVRKAYQVAEDLFNERQYKEYLALGFKTADPVGDLPRYHGKVFSRAEADKTLTVYDPQSQKLVKLSKKDSNALYERGGAIMKLDSQHEVPGGNGRQLYDQILLERNEYRVTDLSTRPFDELHYPGYNFRFYEDPYYVVKEIKGASLNGRAAAAEAKPAVKGIKTAPTEKEAINFLNRFANPVREETGKVTHWVDPKNPEMTYKFVKARDIAQADRTLLQKDVLHKEGRLFWDKRDRVPMESTRGNNANLLDPVRSLDRGFQLVARQTTMEDVMRALRRGFSNEYKGLEGLKKLNLMVDDIGTIIEQLSRNVKNAGTAGERAINERALAYARYIRTQEGVQSVAVPAFRAGMLRAAVRLDKALGKKRSRTATLEKFATEVDPLQAARRTAFLFFMRLRPFRQYALQGAQPLFLAGMDPLYVVSGRGLNDAFALRRGLLRSLGQTDDLEFSAKWLAARMGLSQKEYRKLVKEIDRSGLIDAVNVHAFVGGQRGARRIALPEEEAILGGLRYGTRKLTQDLLDLSQKGFDEGEMLNKFATFNLAWRRMLRNTKKKSILEFTDDDWNKVRLDAENLALAMSPANRARYQEGLAAVTTQFIAFTHRMGLALFGQNPALKGKDLAKVWAVGTMMMGGGFFGAQRLVQQYLDDMGLGEVVTNNPLPDGSTLVDVLSSGMVETIINKMGAGVFDENWTELDLQNNLPVMDTTNYVKMFLDGVKENAILGWMGPSGNIVGTFMEGGAFVHNAINGWPAIQGSTGDKAAWILDMFTRNIVPQYRDATMSYLGYQLDKMITLSGNPQELRSTFNNLVAKGVFGVNSKEATAKWDYLDDVDKLRDMENDYIRSGRKFLRQLIFTKNKGDLRKEAFLEYAAVAGELAQLAPEEIRQNVYEGILGVWYDTDNEDETILHLLSERVQFMSPDDAITHINEFERRSSITPKQAEQLRQFSRDVFDKKVKSNAEIYEIISGQGE